MSIKWTEQELAIVRANPRLDAKELSLLLPGRSHDSVLQKRQRMGIQYFGKKWSSAEDDYLHAHRLDSAADVADALSRPVESVMVRRQEIGARRLTNCHKCGAVIPKRNQFQSCGACKKTEREFSQSLSGKFNNYKHAAKKRGYEFNLSREQFASFWQKDCHYCGAEIATIGIDRQDNSTGYSMSNCVPCCELCNRMKRDLNDDFWIAHMRKIMGKLGELK